MKPGPEEGPPDDGCPMLNMKTLALALFALVPLLGCRSTDVEETRYECICGTQEAAFETCLHESCVAGVGNPENPDCACGTITTDE